MNPEQLTTLLQGITDALSSKHQRDDDVALPIFDPTTNDNGAESWCSNIKTLADNLGWNSVTTVAKAGKALRGSALLWFESWEPHGGRNWENFRTDIIDLYPEKKNLSEKLSKAVMYTSDSADTYCEYAREKIRLLRSTKITLTESQLVELVCGSIVDVNVRMASFNSSVKSTSEMISLFTTYSKPKKRHVESANRDPSASSGFKRYKASGVETERKCYNCGKVGHIKNQCTKVLNNNPKSGTSQPSHLQRPNDFVKRFCTFCNKPGHIESVCFFKLRGQNDTKNPSDSREANFLEQPNLN